MIFPERLGPGSSVVHEISLDVYFGSARPTPYRMYGHGTGWR